MSTPFTLEAKLLLPPDVGLPPDPIALSVASQFDSAADFVLQLSGSGVQSVNLGSINTPGLKGLFVKVDPNPQTLPITVKFNGAVGGIELSVGGGFAYVSPNPQVGITQLDLGYSSPATVRIWSLG